MSFDKELGQNHLNKGEIRTAFGREPAHSPWGIYDSYKGALEGKPLVSKWTASLDGVWKFRHYDRADTVDKFWSEDYSHDDWDNIRVPGNWELQGFGQPVYTNTLYPWKYERDGSHIVNPLDDDSKYGIPNPPKIPEENPAGCYYREFSISDDWADKDVFIYFKGVETVFYCWLNGQAVGYSNDSKLPCEFDISPYLRKGVNTLKVKVLRYADASYLEDQDYWHLCGIYRSVFLYARPKKRLVDWKIEATPDASLSYGSLKADVKINRFDGYGGYRIRLDLYDPDGGLAGTRVGDVNISAEYRQYEKPTSATARIEMDIDNVSLWTPETPHLYRAVMTLLSPTGDQVDFESCKVGFRNIEIKNGIILLNGSRLIIRGVNRHDHDAVTGRTISKEQMIDEIKCMKGLGINSVRTSHYPNDPMWYDLCDEWGLLLVCESNLETHGVFGELTHDPAWGSAFLDRLIRMAVTFKNHASIYSWSLGNESGVGANHAGMAGWIREYDPTRLCQYESGDPDKSISDIRGAMYANQSHIMSMLTDIHDDRPIVLIEYLYNIRNSGGGMNKFLDLSEKYPRFQGGYIWDWKDKSLLKTRADGKNSYAYGGDFGEDIVEWRDPKFMTNNGIVMPDLSLKPVALEVKQVYCPLIIEEILSDNQWDLDEPPGNYIVKNRNHVLDSSHYKIVYKILEDGKEIKTGIFDLALIKPGEDLKVKFNQPFSKKVNSEYYIEFSVRYAYSTPYSKADDEVGVFQFLLGAGELSPLEMSDQVSAAGLCPTNILDWPKATQASLSLDKSSSGFVIAGTGFKVDLDKQSGRLTLICGQERVMSFPMPCFTRPYSGIDGEKGWVRNLTWKRFKPQGTLYRLKRAKAFDTGRDVVIETVIEVDFADFKNGAIVYSKCTIDGSRRIDVNMTFKLNPMVGDMPRVGAEHTIASGYEDLAYYGLGPMENYSDRKSAARLGIFKGRVEDHHFPYNPPSECGGHEETRWVSLSNEAGQNIKFVSPIPFHFDVHHSTIEDYLNAGHDHEIVKRKETIVHIDAAHAGIGGGMGWSTFLGPEHRVEPSTYMLTYAIVF